MANGNTSAAHCSDPGEPHPFSAFVGRSAAIKRVRRELLTASRAGRDVLVAGETGTGKEIAARGVHRAWERPGAFVHVNCAALRPELAGSELFGHRKGAFTGAESSRLGAFREGEGGTVFLDEVNSLDLQAQGYLLGPLEERAVVPIGENRPRPIDVRIVLATNASLRAEVTAGRFRDDLFYRVHGVVVHLPPLRAFPEDIPEIARMFLLDEYGRTADAPTDFRPGAFARLQDYHWPGNVRELRHVVGRAALQCQGGQAVTAEAVEWALEPEAAWHVAGEEISSPQDGNAPYQERMDGFERLVLTDALERTTWVLTQAAADLGISRQRLTDRAKKLGLWPPGGVEG